jgi:hypothetical protein
MSESRVYWNEHMLTMFLDGLEAELPLKWRQVHLDHSEMHPSQCSVFVCPEGHVHFQVAMLAPVGIYTVLGIYAYVLALTLDTRRECPKKPNRKRANVQARLVEEVLAELDPTGSASRAFRQNIGVLREWVKETIKTETIVEGNPNTLDSMPEPHLVMHGLFGPVRGGDA